MNTSYIIVDDYETVPVRSLRIDDFNGQEIISLVLYYPFQKAVASCNEPLKQFNQHSPDYVTYLLISPDSLPYCYSCSLNNNIN